ncbi:hypothetical protein ACHHYP_16852 [Achlya hypogyna]|uniref:EF-hand domain-containing protein n=1 Tax=Achlya hypogyna TaxID=1202772 RepID=A0A1V9Y5L1_ACHHY|nr:hypothetical protein ACHHYP_16852 [Achlya hypogyna]
MRLRCDLDVSAALTPAHLTQLHGMFSAHHDERLDLHRFTEALSAVLEGLPQDQVERLFKRIDANKDGLVGWTEWCSFFLLLDQRSINLEMDATVASLLPLQEITGDTPQEHGVIVRLAQSTIATRGDAAINIYVASTADGVLSLWDASTLRVIARYDALRSRYTTDMTTWIYNQVPYVALSRVDRTIHVAQLTTGLIIETLTGLSETAMSLCASVMNDTCVLVNGDMGGYLNLAPLLPQKLAAQRIKLHTDWLTTIVYEPVLRAWVTASADGHVHFVAGNPPRVLRTFSKHKHGVHTVVAAPTLNLMVSSGAGNDICLWDPYTLKTLAALRGHRAPVHQAVNAQAGKIFSLALDKTVKVWDVYSYLCIQTIRDPNVHYPHDHVECILWDAVNNHLVTSTCQLRIWPVDMVLSRIQATTEVIVVLLLVPLIQPFFTKHAAASIVGIYVMASGDAQSCVNTWDIATGALILRMPGAHGTEGITAMTYDISGQRLVTGASDGSVRIWNGSNGQLLSVETKPIFEVNSLNDGCSIVFVAAVDACVTLFNDTKTADVHPVAMWPDDVDCLGGHTSALLGLCVIPTTSGLVVSTSIDGILCIWSMHSPQYDRVDTSDSPAHWANCVVPYALVDGFISGGSDGRIDFWSIKVCPLYILHV